MLTMMIFRDLEDTRSLDESIENMERGSLASFGSGGTTDSESKQEHKVGGVTGYRGKKLGKIEERNGTVRAGKGEGKSVKN